VLVKALINLLGIYPVGTCILLDTYEIAVVHAANSDPAQLNRPLIRVVCTSEGTKIDPGPIIDLSETENGSYKRSIIKVINPEEYSINPSDYFV